MTSHVRIWSRAQPSDKVAIVESLVKQGNVAAMTGDGVNDAPALTSAEIGVAMGINGTEVTKNAADMILLDDNFSTIVAAVKEGRKIYSNVQKYVLFNLSAKASECACLLTAIIFNLPMPIWGLQQLCNMVVTHIIPPMTIAFEDAEDYTMKIPPRETKNDLVLNRLHMVYRWLPFVLCYAVLMMSSLTLGVWLHTGFVHVNLLVGSSVINAVESNMAACALAGDIDVNGKFVPDVLPYHCRCYIRSNLFAEQPVVQDEWGRVDASEVGLNRFTGYTGSAFTKDSTPFQNGTGSQLFPCTDVSGQTHLCWRSLLAPRPLLAPTNCAYYGSKLGQTMGYASIQLAEILGLMTFRTDGPFWSARISYSYLGVLFFNLTCLAIFVYVPPVTNLLGLAPLSPHRLALACIAPLILVIVAEIIKVEYRRQLRLHHAARGVFRSACL